MSPPGCWLVAGTVGGAVADGLAEPELHADASTTTASKEIHRLTPVSMCAPGRSAPGFTRSCRVS